MRQGQTDGLQPPFRPRVPSTAPARLPLVGRTEEVGRLEVAYERAAEGQGGAFFLTGEAGIGKTRLAHEALAMARERGFHLLEGRAYPLERGLAYGLILDAFGPFLRSLDRVRLSALVSGLDDLGRLFSNLRLPTPQPLGDSSLEKTRLYEAVARLVERLARQAPLALFLDDLHWADSASLELLHYLARSIGGQRVLLLGTFRVEDVAAARGLGALLNSLQRSGLAQQLALSRLEPVATAVLVRGILGSEASQELLAVLDARASGTPLFIEGLTRAFLESGQLKRDGDLWAFTTPVSATLPASVRDLILERLERITLGDRRLLDLVAVSGGDVPHAILRAVSGPDEEALLAALNRLRAAGLMAEAFTGQEVTYRLTHPLIREVAYAELPEMARRRAHALFVAALAELQPDDLERRAYHYRGAGPAADQERALDVLLAAGERARGMYANDQAAQHFGAALALVRQGRRAEMLPSLLESLGEAWEQVGEGAAAIAVWTEALVEFERRGDVAGLARLCRRLALAEWDRGHFAIAEAHLTAGLEALAGREPSQELADLYHCRVIILGRLGDVRGVEAAAEHLLVIARQIEAPRAIAEAYLAKGASSIAQGEFAAARERALLALSAAEAAGEPLLAQRAHDGLGLLSWVLGDHRLARAHAEQSLAVARRLGAPTLELLSHWRLILVDLMAGAWDDARRRSADGLAFARRVGQPRGVAGILAVRALVLAQQGDLDEAEACVAEARRTFGVESASDRHISDVVDLAEAILAFERGDAARAIAITAPWESSRLPVLALGLALAAEAQAANGEAERALHTAHKLVTLGPPDNPFWAGLAAHAEGLARRALGEPESARECLTRAVQAFASLEMPFEAARARLDWATLASATDRDAAVAAAQESLAVFDRLGGRRYARRARQLLYRLGVHPPTATPPKPGGGPLSARELEVARLVAEGLSNAGIAERLVISPHTVTTHISRIYARLGINSRIALARYVVESRLLPPASQDT